MATRFRFTFLFPGLLIFYTAFIYSQNQDFKFDRLDSPPVFTIIQDKENFIWLGSQTGLIRYDGYQFIAYEVIPFDSNSISNVWVTSIIEDTTGHLWIGTVGGGLNCFNKYTQRFTHFRHDPADSNSLCSDHIFALCKDVDGSLWIGTTEKGLSHLEWDHNILAHFLNFEHNPNDPSSLNDNYIKTIYQDKNGLIWIGTMYGGLNRFDKITGKFTHYQRDPLNPYSLSHNTVSAICEDGSGNLWIGTGGWETSQGGGLNKFDPVTEKFTSFRHDPNDPNSISSDLICTMLIDSSGLFWIGTVDGGINVVPAIDLIKYNRDGKNKPPRFIHYRSNPNNRYNPTTNFILSMMEDKTGNIWFGTKGGGTLYLDRHKHQFTHFRHEPGNPNSLGSNFIWCCMEDSHGNLWFGNDQEGIDRYDRDKNQYIHYRHDPANPNSLISNQINTIYEDRQGIFWIGTYNGLDCFDPKTGVFTHYHHDPNDPFSLGSDLVLPILEDRKGQLWIGTILGGLNLFDREKNRFIRFQNNPSDPNSIGGNVVSVLYEDSLGDLWIGTQGSGLSRLIWKDPDTTYFKNYLYNPKDINSISYNTIFSITESIVHEKGILWIGTPGGLNRFDKKTGKFNLFSEKDGMPDSFVEGILEDNQGYLWIGMKLGFSRFDPLTKSFKNYNRGDGLPFVAFTSGSNASCFKNKSGELFFSGQGVLSFQPDQIKDNPHKPAVCLTGFKIFNESVRPDTSLTFIKQIKLSYKQNIFSFRFAALNYTNPQKNQYSYQMEGFQDDWIYNGNDNTATFTNLDPGEYTFRVKGSNNDGVWNEEGTSVKIIITPPFWKTAWFRLLILLAAAGLIYLIYRYRINRLLELERMRIQIASDLHDDIGSTLTKIAVNSEIIQTTGEKTKVRESSRKIGEMSREIITTLSDVVWSIDARNDTVGDLTDRMRDFLDAVFQPGTIQIEFRTRGLHFQQKISQELRQNIYLIFKEAVHNAAKHSEANQLRIQLTNGNGKFRMEISDNGTGIDMNKTHTEHHGLENMKLRAARIGGDLKVETRQGTRVILTAKAI